MTLSSTTSKVQYSGDGSTVSFAVTFVFWATSELQVVFTDTDGTQTTWTEGTQYTVSGGAGAKGAVTVSTSPTDYTPASSTTLTITSNLPNTQPTDLVNGGNLSSAALEKQFDQLVRQVQQLSEKIGRALIFPTGDSTSLSGQIPNSTDRASARLGFDANGEPVAVTSDLSAVATTAFIDTLLDDADAATARGTLAAPGTGVVNTFTKTQTWSKGADVASASALTLGTDGNWFDITGTTAITSIGTLGVGTLVALQFDGSLTLTHHATNLVLPDGQDIVTQAGDIALLYEYASADWRLIGYMANVAVYKQKAVDLSQKVTFFDDFIGTISTPISSTAGSGTGNAAATISAGAGGRVTLTSASNDGTHAANCSTLTLDVLDWRADQGGLILETRLQIDDVSEAVIFVGFTDTISSTVELPIYKTSGADTIDSDAANACGIGYDVDGTTDQWFHGGVAAGTDTAATHSGTAPSDGTYVTLRVEVSAAGAVEGFVDGVSIGTATAAAVTTTTPLTPAIVIGNRSANQVIATIDYLWVQANR